MIVKLYSVFDIKAQAYASPFFCAQDGLAIRMFSDAIADPKTNLNRHSEDYKLYCVGEFDDVAGEVFGYKVAKFLVNASDFVPVVSPVVVAKEA